MKKTYKTYKGYKIPDNIVLDLRVGDRGCVTYSTCKYLCSECILNSSNRDIYFEYVNKELRKQKLGRILDEDI